jgi:hypothetical protein
MTFLSEGKKKGFNAGFLVLVVLFFILQFAIPIFYYYLVVIPIGRRIPAALFLRNAFEFKNTLFLQVMTQSFPFGREDVHDQKDWLIRPDTAWNRLIGSQESRKFPMAYAAGETEIWVVYQDHYEKFDGSNWRTQKLDPALEYCPDGSMAVAGNLYL